MKKISQVTVGDTITDYDNPAQQRLQGYLKQQPVVFCAVFPEDSSNYGLLTSALKKINLSDSSFTFKKMASDALGFGFHCGFIGNLHMEIILERIRREHHLVLITTAPCVEYHLGLTNNQKLITSNPSDFPEPSRINTIAEPIAEVKFLVDVKYLGKLISFLETKRGVYKNFQVITTTKQILIYEMPLNEVIFDFFGQIKALSKGFISYSYGFSHYQPSKLSKVDILINHNVVSPLSSIFPTSQAAMKARKLCLKLKANIPRQNIEIIIQAAINKKIIARETIKAVRKDVIAGLYGGDISRKKKLLQKQKKGKKNRTKFGKVSIPHQAFLAALKP